MRFLEDEAYLGALKKMIAQLGRVNASNRVFEGYYEGSEYAKSLGISIPPRLAGLRTVLGWPAAIVDSLEERLDFRGWHTVNDRAGLREVFAQNSLDDESGMVHLDALIHGVGFVSVHAGGVGEPDTVVSVESPKRATGILNSRTRRLDFGLLVEGEDKNRRFCFLTPRESFILAGAGADSFGVPSSFEILDVDEHKLGRVPLVPFRNRRRSSREWGRSEITRPIRSLTDMGVRSCLGMEVNREFYAAPQRWVMGATREDFQDSNGGVVTGWEAVMGRYLALGADEDTGTVPTVGQFPASSPQPFIEQLRALSQLAAAEGSIPAHYLGFVTDNPASADSIRATEARLVKHAERRQTAFGYGWQEVANLVAVSRGVEPENVIAKWSDASTPTRAATTDAVVKLIQVGAMPATSEVTYEMLGFAPDQIAQLTLDSIRERQTARIQSYATGLDVSAQAARARGVLAQSERG